MKRSKRLLSLLLVLVFVVSLFPTAALAEEPEEPAPEPPVTEEPAPEEEPVEEPGEDPAPAEEPGEEPIPVPEDPEDPDLEEGEDPDALPPEDEIESVASGYSGYVRWTLSADGVLEFSNPILHNPIADYGSPDEVPWYEYRDQIYTVRVGSQISRIGNYAFYGLNCVHTFQIADDVKEIGSHAFEGCSGFGTQNSAFGNFLSIIPASVETIGDYAFKDCTGMTTIYPLFNGSASSLSSLGLGVFSGCTGLTQAILPNTITSIPYSCFENCSKLNMVSIPTGAGSIGPYAFRGCLQLTEIYVPDGLQNIWGNAFEGCSGLVEVTLPGSIRMIGASAFADCSSLSRIYFNGKLSGWGIVANSISAVGNDPLIYAELVPLEDDPEHMCGDDLQWTVYGGTLYIAGSGAMYDYGSGSATPWASLRSQIQTVQIYTGVTTVGGCAFSGCENLKTLYLPATITAIGDSASYACASLTDVYYHGTMAAFQAIDIEGSNMAIEDAQKHYLSVATGICGLGLTWVYDGTSLTISGNGYMYDWDDPVNVPWRAYVGEIPRVQIDINVGSIGKNAFNGCTALTEVKLYYSLRAIGDNAFRGCTALENISLPDSVHTIGTAAFRDCTKLKKIEFPASLTAVSDECCYGCNTMNIALIPAGVTSIGVSAFEGCTSLTNFTCTVEVLSVGDRACYGCTALDEAWMPGATQVGEYAFFGCSSLSTVYAPALQTINAHAFQNCTALQTVSLPAAVSVGPYAFHSCDHLSSISIPAAESIGDFAFVSCGALHEISLPGTLRSIGYNAFSGAGLNGNLVIPDGMQTINTYAFANTGITAVTIPTSVTSIEKGAFRNCTSLADVYYSGAQVMWDAISIIETDNEPLLNASLHLAPNSGTVFDDGTNQVYWSLSDDGVLTIYGTGGTGDSFASAEDQPWYTSASMIHTVRITGTVSSIPKYCCYGLTNLSTVEMCDSVTLIGENAFRGCSSMTSLQLSANLRTINNYAFRDCWSLHELELPSSLRTIGYGAFFNCSGLRELVLPDSVTSMNIYAFAYCSNLKTVRLSAGLTTLTARSFQNCSALEEIDIPEGVTLLGICAFQDCSSLQVVRLPHSLVPNGDQYNPYAIGHDVFNGCAALTDVYYNGTLAEWKALDVNETGNEPLLAATLHVLPTSGSFANGLTWSYSADGILTISGSGPMPDFNEPGDQPWFDYQQMITGIRVLDGVTAVGAYAFYGLERAKTAELADSITKIGMNGFAFCTGLETLNFPANLETIQVRAFESVGLLGQDLVLPDGLLSVYDYAFSGAGMDSVRFPDSVRNLGWSVFENCPHLMGLNFPEGVSEVPLDFCKNCPEFLAVSFPEGVTSIGSGAFSYCGALGWVQFPSTLLTIGYGAFMKVGTVEIVEYAATEEEWAQVIIDSQNTAIEHPTKFLVARGLLCGDIYWWVSSQGALHVRGPGAMPDFAAEGTAPWYEYRDSITQIWVDGKLYDPAGGITYIGDYAFAGLEHVDYVTINDCCTGIGDHAFEGCAAIPYIWLPDQLESIGDYAFAECTQFDLPELPEGVADIGESAFEGCSSLSEVSLPESMSFGGIGPHAFASCSNLTSVTIRGLEQIPEGAFYRCTKLCSVTIPVSVTSVGYGAFGGCNALSSGDVWYDGLQVQWNAIEIESYNDPLLSANLHCAPSYGMLENGLQWSFSDGVLTISGSGPMPDFESNSDAPWFSFKEYVTGVEIQEGVTYVGENAFVSFTHLTELTLPDGLTEIGYQAFRGCTALASVTLPASIAEVGVGAFYGCSALADVYFGGTPLQWDLMNVDDYNEPLLNAALHYTLEGVPIDEEHFPCEAFREYVKSEFDTDGNWLLTADEIADANVVEVSGDDFTSLQGVEYLTGLEELYCGGCQLTELDVSMLEQLYLLYCEGNQLTEGTLILPAGLTELDCSVNGGLHRLDLSGLPNLWFLTCDETGLTELDLSAVPRLRYLYCERNALTRLDVSGNPALMVLVCADNPLTELILGENENLGFLDCFNTYLTSLDITGCPILLNAKLNGTFREDDDGAWIWHTPNSSYRLRIDPSVTIVTETEPDHIPGDINGDGVVNNKDVTRLMRYLKDPTIAVNEAALDVNGDGKVTNKDVTRLVRYLKHHDVDIF